jgi:hypothetical protein
VDDRYVGAQGINRWSAQLPQAEVRTIPAGGHQFLLRIGFEAIADWISSLPLGPTRAR